MLCFIFFYTDAAKKVIVRSTEPTKTARMLVKVLQEHTNVCLKFVFLGGGDWKFDRFSCIICNVNRIN